MSPDESYVIDPEISQRVGPRAAVVYAVLAANDNADGLAEASTASGPLVISSMTRTTTGRMRKAGSDDADRSGGRTTWIDGSAGGSR